MIIKKCSYCVMDNESDDSITFNEEGRCNYCLEAEKRKKTEYFPNEVGEKKLEEIIYKIKEETKDLKYNCIVGISGGIDSSYVLYLGYKYSLKMLAVHIDDGLDTEISKANIKKLCEKTKVDLITIKPDKAEYADLTLSFLKASVPNLAMPQDNILFKELQEIVKKYKIKYSLSGLNFSLESILERSDKINSADGYHILSIHKKYGSIPLRKIKLNSIFNAYIVKNFLSKTIIIKPLNYIDYNLERALKELKDFCDFTYYGRKHHENILTRFLQCYYLPVKFNKDKRKSHLSSMIVSEQLTRKQALEILKENPYISNELFESDLKALCQYFNISKEELFKYINQPAKSHRDYPISIFNYFASIARKFRKYLQ